MSTLLDIDLDEVASALVRSFGRADTYAAARSLLSETPDLSAVELRLCLDRAADLAESTGRSLAESAAA